MRILGIDPGATTGWCIYDTDDHEVREAGRFEDAPDVEGWVALSWEVAAVERLVPHGASYPQVVDAAYTAGVIVGSLRHLAYPYQAVETLTRHEVRAALQEACHGAVKVRDDASVWAALVLMHGEGSGRKPRRKKGQVVDAGGAIGRVTSHERAALAVAVAYALLHPEDA